MTQRTTTHLPGVVQGYQLSRALCNSGGGTIVDTGATCVTCQRLHRIGNPMAENGLAARLATPNPLNLPTVVIFHDKGVPPKDILSLFDERTPLRVVHDRKDWHTTDYVVDKASLSNRRERFAARMGALPVVLPEQTNWIMGQIAARITGGQDVYLFLPYPGCEGAA